MTSRDFCYWLQGHLEIARAEGLSAPQVEIVQRHLALVFKHEIDPSIAAELQAIHNERPKMGGTGPNAAKAMSTANTKVERDDLAGALEIASRSADDQMWQKREAQAELAAEKARMSAIFKSQDSLITQLRGDVERMEHAMSTAYEKCRGTEGSWILREALQKEPGAEPRIGVLDLPLDVQIPTNQPTEP